tara:strand:+ start:3926 stop:4111 length:186 start_codon:yes stop_codon:yes gene_type:complete
MTTQTLSNKDFVINSYRDLLNREPDAEGLQYWIDDLEKRGQSRADVLANIKLSDEYQAMDS